VRVRFVDDEPSGLALMVGGLIQQNLERDPGRARHLDGSVVAIVAPDADVAISIRLGPGEIEVADGVRPDAHLVVTASSDRLLHMTSSPLRFGLPDALSRHGREVLGHVLSRRVRIEGLVRGPHRLARLTKLLSVHEAE
jgi:hypothetical protein